jgi:8-oxo-dGTP pyrophosphatase MutT (NUDIX family)
VAGILLLEDGRYLLQHRDERQDIWYPGHWGCFGGAVDEGESPEAALRRELFEELEYRLTACEFILRFRYDIERYEPGTFFRDYYLVRIRKGEESALRLHEGQAMRAFSRDEVEGGLKMTPYDSFALKLFAQGSARFSSDNRPAQR